MRSFVPAVIFVIAAFITIFLVTPVYQVGDKYAEESVSSLGTLPEEFFQAMSFEFKGVAADFLLLKAITFMGMKLIDNQNPSTEEWRLMYDMLDRVTDLDGRFWDPYVLAEMMLVWQGGMIDEANELLKKAVEHRPEDHRPLYYIGFNYFYFQKNSEKAAGYLRQAAQLPGAPGFLKGLASRLSLYGNQTALGIVFLENLLQNSQDEHIRTHLEKRLLALKIIYGLEQKVIEFRDENQRLPASLDQLVDSGIIETIPIDPYGGTFILMENGRIYSTSKLVNPTKDKGRTGHFIFTP